MKRDQGEKNNLGLNPMPILLRRFFILSVFAALAVPFFGIFGLSPEEERTQLEEELKKLEEQIAKYEQDVNRTAAEKQTLQNQIYSLRRQIEKLDLQISQGNLMIKDLGNQIQDTEKSIDGTEEQIQKYRMRLAEFLRVLYQESQQPLIAILLGERELSDFFERVVALERLNMETQDLLASIKDLKGYLESQKTKISDEKDDLQRVVKLQMLQKDENARKRGEQQYFLNLTETQYQAYLYQKNAAEQKAAEIRARIFELIGVPDAPTFGEAVVIARGVEGLTGVRTAFLLAILTQESNIGKNVGQCNIADTVSGRSTSIRTGQTFKNGIHPSRDLPPFLTITRELGRDSLKTPISCPIPSVGGYGGAMGPAQFIPSTWMLYKDRITQLKGGSPDPWNVKDAFLASAVYLKDVGAAKRTYNSEWCAAIAYFSGSCSSRNQSRYGFYANRVMAIAEQYERDIATISK